MPFELIHDWPEAPDARRRLRAQWDGLLDEVDGATVFQGYDWHEAWWQTFGRSDRLRLLLVRDEHGALVAIAPLALTTLRRFGLRREVLMLIGTRNHASDYADFIVARGHGRARQAIVDWLAGERWHALELRNLPAWSASLTLFEDDDRLPRALLQCSAEAPTRRLGDTAADRQAANKKSLRRHLNGFAREAPVTLRRLLQHDEIEAHLEPFFEQHCARWAGTPTPSPFNDPAQRAFYRRLAARLAARGELHFTAVFWNDCAIAYHFGFERDGVLTWYKPSFDPTLERRSPGEVLIKLLLDDAIERGLRELDFTVGSESFKFRFANAVRHVYRLRLQRHAWERWPALAREALKRRWLAWRGAARQTPAADIDASSAAADRALTQSRRDGRADTGTRRVR